MQLLKQYFQLVMVLTEEIANKEITDFFLKNPSPLIVFGTGTSCAIDIRFGMAKLKEELIEKVPLSILGIGTI
jgi:hypothetical protein